MSEETALGTSPTNPDSDNDGLSDGAEGGLGKNPLVADNPNPGNLPLAGKLTVEAGVTSPGVLLSADGYSATFNAQLNSACEQRTGIFADPVYGAPSGDAERCRKRAIRANVGVKPTEFRYFETHRTGSTLENIGQGIITTGAQIDPYCCFVEQNDTVNYPYNSTPPSMTINSVGGVFVRLVNFGANYSPAPLNLAATQYYGFAVDYRGANPVVYLVGKDISGAMTVSDGVAVANFGGGDAMPMLHGHPQAVPRQPLVMNLGLRKFHYDLDAVRAALTARGAANVSEFVPGVGLHRWN